MYNKIVFYIYLGLLVLVSLITFMVFLKDKKIAVKGGGKMRIKEKTLLGLTVLNGAIGAFFGRLVAHHKTDKVYFSITIYLALLCQVAVLGLLFFLGFCR